MYTGIKHIHSVIAYILLAGILISIIYASVSFLKNTPFTEKNRKVSLIGLVSAHTQMVLGIILYIISPLGISNFSGDTMKNDVGRLYALEHPLMMLLGIVLITVGYSKAKRGKDSRKRNKHIIIFYLIGLILILSRIPWATWP